MKRVFCESLSRGKRAAIMRVDAIECGRRGFATIAEVLREHAELLAPQPREIAPIKPARRYRRERRGEREAA